MANWKREELRVAKMFGTSRALMKGTDEKSDIISDLFCVDVKLRQRIDIQKHYRELRAAARKEDKIPILVVRRPKDRIRLAVLDCEYLVSILKGAGLLEEPE